MFQLPSPADLFGSLLFGIVGFAAWRYGRKTGGMQPMAIGVALMVFPYFVSRTWLLYAIGGALCAGLVIFRKPS